MSCHNLKINITKKRDTCMVGMIEISSLSQADCLLFKVLKDVVTKLLHCNTTAMWVRSKRLSSLKNN